MTTETLHRQTSFCIEALNLDRDWPEIDRLLILEDWPFVRADFEASHAQPGSVGLVARQPELHASTGAIAGFFVAHPFGDVGYLDMMIVDPTARQSKLATKLAFETDRQLRRSGMRGFVAHSTHDSYGVFRFFGFEAGQSFTLLRREQQQIAGDETLLDHITLGLHDLSEVLALDSRVFGRNRAAWIQALMQQRTTRFVGLRRGGTLVASVCLRARRENAYCLDAANAVDFTDLRDLLANIVTALPHRRLECFAKTGSDLHHWFAAQGWEIPAFFQKIGPLVEWRKGATRGVGDTPCLRSLNWF